MQEVIKMKYVNFHIDGELEKEILLLKKKRYPHIGIGPMFIELAKKAIEEDPKNERNIQ